MAIPNIGEIARVCLQSWMGTFVCAEEGGGGIVVVNRPEPKGWETFEMKRLDADHVTLKAFKGQYLCAVNGGGTVVVANRVEAQGWETFGISIDSNGLVTLSANNGQFVCAEPNGVLVANRDEAKGWEAFRIVDPAHGNWPQTRIEVNVYKLAGLAPLWHTGTVIDGREYYFHTTNKVQNCDPKGHPAKHHRTLVRLVPGNLDHVKSVFDTVKSRWDDTRYDVAAHNCDRFTNDLLQSLGVSSLNKEYIDASGLAKGLRQTPGGATLQELLVKWPIKDKRLDEAFLADLKRLRNVPKDIINELDGLGDDISREWKNVIGI